MTGSGPARFLRQDLIRKKWDGRVLEDAEIAFVIDGITDGAIADGPAAALAMFVRGMTMAEQVAPIGAREEETTAFQSGPSPAFRPSPARRRRWRWRHLLRGLARGAR